MLIISTANIVCYVKIKVINAVILTRPEHSRPRPNTIKAKATVPRPRPRPSRLGMKLVPGTVPSRTAMGDHGK